METTGLHFLEYWNYAMIIGAIVMVSLAIVLYLVHHLRVSALSSYKAKYDFINTHEIRNYKSVFTCLGLATVFVINLYGMGSLHQMGVWFFVRLFISIAGGTLVAYVAFLILEYYYPTVVHKNLRNGGICRG
jgi:hypothetical protein